MELRRFAAGQLSACRSHRARSPPIFSVKTQQIAPALVLILTLTVIILLVVSLRYWGAHCLFMLDHPEADAPGSACRTAAAMTKNHRMELFLLSLSLLPWMLLCALTAGILLIWKMPYFAADRMPEPVRNWTRQYRKKLERVRELRQQFPDQFSSRLSRCKGGQPCHSFTPLSGTWNGEGTLARRRLRFPAGSQRYAFESEEYAAYHHGAVLSSTLTPPSAAFMSTLFEHLSEVPMSVISVEFAEGVIPVDFQGLHPGAKELLYRLRDAGIQQVILSSNHLASIEADLARFGIRDCFSQVLGAEDQLYGSRQGAARGLDWLAGQSVEPEEDMVLIGDSLTTTMTPQKPWGFPAFFAPLGTSPGRICSLPVFLWWDQFSQLEALLKNSSKN